MKGTALHQTLTDPTITIWVLSGFETAAVERFSTARLSAVLNSPEQVAAFTASGLGSDFALQP